jgi:hypothetical protein
MTHDVSNLYSDILSRQRVSPMTITTNQYLLYIGAGTDMSPLLLTQYARFVFIDQCPDNSTGHMGYHLQDNNKVPVPYKSFKSNIQRNIRQLGITIDSVSEVHNDLWVFDLKRFDKTISLKYHVNQVYPDVSQNVIDDISSASSLFIRGFIPHEEVFNTAPVDTIYSSGDACNVFAKGWASKLKIKGETISKLRYFDLLQHGESRNLSE